MLNNIKRNTKKLLINLVLGIIILSFCVVGGINFTTNHKKKYIVTFNNTASISLDDFLWAKSREIDLLRKNNNIALNDLEIEELNLDKIILNKLIRDSMLTYLAKCYDFDISENMLINYIKQLKIFYNKDNEFDLELFKQILSNPSQQKEYLNNVKNNLIAHCMLDIFIQSLNPATIMMNNTINYMAEYRIFNLVYIDLKNKPKNYKDSTIPTKDNLNNLYQANLTKFLKPELRSFYYIKINSEMVKKDITISDDEIKKYYNSYQDLFLEKGWIKNKSAIKDSLRSIKIEEQIQTLIKELEYDITKKDLTLEEISQKYKIPLIKHNLISIKNMTKNNSKDLELLSDTVFDMEEGEISYPIELANQNEFAVIELKSIQPAYQQTYEEVELQLKTLFAENNLKEYNLNNLKNFHANYNNKKENLPKTLNIRLIENQSLNRVDLMNHTPKLPDSLKDSIFNSKQDNVTPIIIHNNKAFFAFVKKIATNNSQAKKILTNNYDNIVNNYKESLLEEMITYLTYQNNMVIHTHTYNK